MRTGLIRYLVACCIGAWSVVGAGTPLSASVAPLTRSSAHPARHVVHRVQTPMDAYVFVPGLGTMVISVKSDGRTTIAPVPAHLNESNFNVDVRSLTLLPAQLRFGAPTIAKPSVNARKRRSA